MAKSDLTNEPFYEIADALKEVSGGLYAIRDVLFETLGSEKTGNALDGLADISNSIYGLSEAVNNHGSIQIRTEGNNGELCLFDGLHKR